MSDETRIVYTRRDWALGLAAFAVIGLALAWLNSYLNERFGRGPEWLGTLGLLLTAFAVARQNWRQR